jgi:hypothetical protein
MFSIILKVGPMIIFYMVGKNNIRQLLLSNTELIKISIGTLLLISSLFLSCFLNKSYFDLL